MATTSMSFSPHTTTLARSNNTRKPTTRKLLKNSNPNPRKHQLKPPNPSRHFPPLSLSGGDATTYTRLPPKDDFSLPFHPTTLHSSTELKLSESTITKTSLKQKQLQNNFEIEIDESSSEDEKLGFDYGKFELFEVNSDSELENDEEFYGDGEGLGFDGEEIGEEEEEEVREKEKGVPAVMRCFDRTKIFVKAGDGGNGVVAFRREKYVPLGGPSGGDGGRGGNVYVEVEGTMNSLLPFRKQIHFRGGRGGHGRGQKQYGAKGESVVVKVPPGTVIREAGKDGVQGEVLLELLYPGQRALLLAGGRGGRGNASFKSGTNKVPKIAENGEEGPEL